MLVLNDRQADLAIQDKASSKGMLVTTGKWPEADSPGDLTSMSWSDGSDSANRASSCAETVLLTDKREPRRASDDSCGPNEDPGGDKKNDDTKRQL